MKANAKHPPVLRLRRAIEDIIRTEIEDGHAKQTDSRQWGDTGTDIVTAAGMAFDAVDSITGDDAKDYLSECMVALHKTHLQYRRDYDDDSGYGSETLYSIKAAAAALGNDLGIRVTIPPLPDTITPSDTAVERINGAALVANTPSAPQTPRGIFRRIFSFLGL